MEVVFRSLVHQLRPVARIGNIWILSGIDPSVGGHQLECQHDDSSGEAHNGEDVDQTFFSISSVIIIISLKCRHLRRGGKRSAERLSRSLKLHGGFRQSDRRRGTAARSDRTGWRAGSRETDGRSRSHGRRGTCGAERNRRRGRGRTWCATGSSRGGRSGWNWRPDRRSHRHRGGGNSRRGIRCFQGHADGFLLEGHTRCLLAQWHARCLLGRGWLIFVIAHALAGFELLRKRSKATCPPAVKPPNRDLLKNKETWS